MKKYSLYLLTVLIMLFSSCSSIKSTLMNVDNNTQKPAIKGGHYVITEYSNDDKFGYDKNYPINLGFDNEKYGTRSIDYFFNALQGKNGEKLSYVKVDNCCPFPTKRGVTGGGILEIYEIKFEGSNKKITLYFNIYDKGKILCPNGFSIK